MNEPGRELLLGMRDWDMHLNPKLWLNEANPLALGRTNEPKLLVRSRNREPAPNQYYDVQTKNSSNTP